MVSRFGRSGRVFRGAYRWRRSALTAVAAVTVVALSVSQAGSSRAQEGGGEFTNGTAKATAWVTKIAPAVGNLELALTSGVSVSEMTNNLAQSQSSVLDLGLIGSTLTAEQCDGSDPPLDPSTLPQDLRADNRNGDVKRSEAEQDGGPFAVGRRTVEALTVPASSAITEAGTLDLAPGLSLSGGRSHSATEVLPGKGREARATSEISLSIAGIELNAMRWEARHRTGADYVSEGSFSLGSVGGDALLKETEDIEDVEQTINTVLGATGSGLQVDFPEVRHIKEPVDLVRVTPLRIIFRDSDLATLALGAILGESRAQREQAFDALAEIYCKFASVLLVGDVLLTIASGTGFLAVDIGGAEALSGEFVAGDAIEIPDIPPVTEDENGGAPPPRAPPANGAAPSGPSVVSGVDPGGDDRPTELGAAPAADLGPIERVCRSVHPFEWPSCSNGAAPLAGALGLVATGAVFALDFRRNRLTGEAVPA